MLPATFRRENTNIPEEIVVVVVVADSLLPSDRKTGKGPRWRTWYTRPFSQVALMGCHVAVLNTIRSRRVIGTIPTFSPPVCLFHFFSVYCKGFSNCPDRMLDCVDPAIKKGGSPRNYARLARANGCFDTHSQQRKNVDCPTCGQDIRVASEERMPLLQVLGANTISSGLTTAEVHFTNNRKTRDAT